MSSVQTEDLAALLHEAGSAYDPAGVEAIIRGVLAAPPEIGTSWHALIADPAPPALAQALETLRDRLAERYRDGLAVEDFERQCMHLGLSRRYADKNAVVRMGTLEGTTQSFPRPWGKNMVIELFAEILGRNR